MNLKEASLLKFYYLAIKHLNLLILKVFSISPSTPKTTTTKQNRQLNPLSLIPVN